MEETLRDLEQVMAAHRKALAETRVARPVPPPALLAGPVLAPARANADLPDERYRLMQRLSDDIARVSGIEITGLMEAKLARVLASVGLAELENWVGRLHLLPADDPEWLSLIETLTVHETFFHRDRSQLELLAGVLPEAIAAAAREERHRLRLWSAGCATGEEAYTLAILALLALRDAGLADPTSDGGICCRAPWQIDVLGTDISRLVLAQAETAVYSTEGLSAFRELPSELQRFFPVLPKGGDAGDAERRGVIPAIRRHVRFARFNLVAGVPPETGFDVVLCRNVLIYLTAAARIEAQRLFRHALRPGGYLLLGPTDAAAEPDAYEVRWGKGALAYRLKPHNA